MIPLLGPQIAELLAAKGIPLDIVEARFPGVRQCDAPRSPVLVFLPTRRSQIVSFKPDILTFSTNISTVFWKMLRCFFVNFKFIFFDEFEYIF